MSDYPAAQVTKTICNALWGNQLSFHPFSRGDAPVDFTTLWPNKQTLAETYTHANIEQAPYELCKLLVASNSARALDALLEERILQVNLCFQPGSVTMAHLGCVVGEGDILQVLAKRSQSNNGVWLIKDDQEHTPVDVCFHPELKRFLPGRSFFNKKKLSQGLPLKNESRDKIFELARNPEQFYNTILNLQKYLFDVNRVKNSNGDLLIHVAVKGGLPQLPLLFCLVRQFRASMTATDRSGHTPLCLAAKRGEERIAEILICMFGADINAPTSRNGKTPLHWAVEYNHPSVVSMLLRRGADSSSEDGDKCVPVFIARRLRYHECAQIITQFQMERVARLAMEATNGTLDVSRLYTNDTSIVTNSGCTLLMLATLNNRERTVRDLVKMKHCPLDFKQMKSCDLFDSDDSSGSQVTEITSSETEYSLKTAAHMAAENGYSGCLQALLDAGAQPSVPDAASWLPLHYACDRGHIDCVTAILSFPNQQGLCGLKSACDIARGNGQAAIVALLEEAMETRQTELVNPLLFDIAHSGSHDTLFAVLENGDNVNPINEAHDWPLLLAAGYGHLELVQQLHEFGGHVTRRHKISRSTPLHVAARGGHKEVVRYLLGFCVKGDGTCPPSPFPTGATIPEEHPPNLYINDRNTNGCTPLELAVSQGHLDIVRILLEHRASTTLPDSNGCLLNSQSFAGTQFLMETHRKEKKRRINGCLNPRATIKDIKKVWESPSDFNLNRRSEDSFIMTAAQWAKPEVLQFLINQANKCTPDMRISTGQPLQSVGMYSSSAEDSSPDHDNLEGSLPSGFKLTQTQNDHILPQSALPAPRHEKGAEVTVTSLGPTPSAFPQTALPSIGHKKRTEARAVSKAPLGLPGDVGSDPCDSGGDHALPESRTSLPPVVRTQVPASNRFMQYQSDQGVTRRRSVPKKPPRLRQRTTSDMSSQPGLLQRTPSSSTTPLSDEDERTCTKLPGIREGEALSGMEPVTNGYGGGVSSGAESGGDREFIKLLQFTNPNDGCTALHRAAENCRHDNVAVLLCADEELANVQDCVGNTALHVACYRAHKQTVKALLGFKCVSTVVRNSGRELPEDRCMRRDIRKMVAKARHLQHGDQIPERNGSPKHPRGMASVGVVENGASQPPDPDTHRTTSPVVDQQLKFEKHFEKLKEEYEIKKQNGQMSGNQ